MIDTSEHEEVLTILEDLEDQTLATSLLREFNDKSKEFGLLLMNLDENMTNDEWKIKCDLAGQKLSDLIKEIKGLGR